MVEAMAWPSPPAHALHSQLDHMLPAQRLRRSPPPEDCPVQLLPLPLPCPLACPVTYLPCLPVPFPKLHALPLLCLPCPCCACPVPLPWSALLPACPVPCPCCACPPWRVCCAWRGGSRCAAWETPPPRSAPAPGRRTCGTQGQGGAAARRHQRANLGGNWEGHVCSAGLGNTQPLQAHTALPLVLGGSSAASAG